MGIISEIKFQKKNKKRVSIYVDGEFVTGLEAITVASKNLKVGDAVDGDELIALSLDSLKSEAFDKALKYVSTAMHTEKEVGDNLAKKEYPTAVIDYCLVKLKEYGYLNDERYAKLYVQTYAQSRGVNKIKLELINKGVDKEITESALAQIEGQADAAVIAAEKYVKSHKNATKQKLMQHLYSKGFSYSDINTAVDSVELPTAFEE